MDNEKLYNKIIMLHTRRRENSLPNNNKTQVSNLE